MGEWINFKELRSRLDFRTVLDHYGVELNAKGDQAQGFCPLPTHNGQKRSASFSVNFTRGIWQCFGCGSSGNVLDFAVRMEGKLPDNAADVREVALGLQDWLKLKPEPDHPRKSVTRSDSPRSRPPPKPPSGQQSLLPLPTTSDTDTPATPEVRINARLDFKLQGLQPEHPYLRDRGFTAQTIWRFGLGYCSRGLMAGRIAIPLYDADDWLVGYAGRLVDDSRITSENPKYKLPSRREHDGVIHEFRKSHLLYNAHRFKEPVDHLVVVEGFPSVWWLHQAGITNVVATMGSSCSPEQAAIIVGKTLPTAHIIVLPDGDEAGQRFRQSVFETLGPKRAVRWIPLPDGKQPTDCDSKWLTQHFGA
jgi:DNA primase